MMVIEGEDIKEDEECKFGRVNVMNVNDSYWT